MANFETTNSHISSVLLSSGQYIGDPIDCWTPAEFSGQWTKYADQYCWVKNTYYVPMTENIPDHLERGGLEITYYQWTPIILAFQALLFVIPGLLWKVWKLSLYTSLPGYSSLVCWKFATTWRENLNCAFRCLYVKNLYSSFDHHCLESLPTDMLILFVWLSSQDWVRRGFVVFLMIALSNKLEDKTMNHKLWLICPHSMTWLSAAKILSNMSASTYSIYPPTTNKIFLFTGILFWCWIWHSPNCQHMQLLR